MQHTNGQDPEKTLTAQEAALSEEERDEKEDEKEAHHAGTESAHEESAHRRSDGRMGPIADSPDPGPAGCRRTERPVAEKGIICYNIA